MYTKISKYIIPPRVTKFFLFSLSSTSAKQKPFWSESVDSLRTTCFWDYFRVFNHFRCCLHGHLKKLYFGVLQQQINVKWKSSLSNEKQNSWSRPVNGNSEAAVLVLFCEVVLLSIVFLLYDVYCTKESVSPFSARFKHGADFLIRWMKDFVKLVKMLQIQLL